MIDEERYRIYILTQISAITKALESVALGLLDAHLRDCVLDAQLLAQGTHAVQMLLHTLGRGEDPGQYRPRSAYMAVIYGRMIAGVGYTGYPDTRIEGGAEEFVVLHEHGDAVVGASGIDAVGTVFQWGQRLHEVYS
jgi:hypothetical protein